MAKIEAIVDAGPLIHLAELDKLDILQTVDTLFITDAVWEEVSRHQARALTYPGLKLERHSAPKPSAELQALTLALDLDQGEIECLALIESRRAAWLLTDDAAARLVAEQRGYRVHGTIGLLIRSVREGQHTGEEIIAMLRDLPRKSTLFVRPEFLQTILNQLEKEWKTK